MNSEFFRLVERRDEELLLFRLVNVPVLVAGDVDANDDVGMFYRQVDYRHRVFPQTDNVGEDQPAFDAVVFVRVRDCLFDDVDDVVGAHVPAEIGNLVIN